MRPIDPYDLIDDDYETFLKIAQEHEEWEARQIAQSQTESADIPQRIHQPPHWITGGND